MKRLPFLLAVVGLASCGYTEDSYISDYVDVVCGLYAECDLYSEYFTQEMCESIGDTTEDTGATTTTCTFDGDIAQDCISAWEEITCDDLTAGNVPSVCANVYSCE